MKCYVVTVELASDRVRDRLRERLKVHGQYCPIHKRCWAIMTEQSADEIRDSLAEVLTPADRLFVIRSGTEAAWRNPYGPKNDEWLKKNLSA